MIARCRSCPSNAVEAVDELHVETLWHSRIATIHEHLPGDGADAKWQAAFRAFARAARQALRSQMLPRLRAATS